MNHIVPRSVQQFLTSFGGRNPFGQPHWRLLVGADRLVKEAGVYRDWAEGLSTAEKGGMRFEGCPDQPGVNFGRYENKPIRVVTEMREIRKYPHAEGWILEKWFPASAYGTQEDWYSYKAVDGFTSMLGPYPERGDYEMIYGPWPRIPSTGLLQRYVSSYAAGINSRVGTAESRAQEALLRYEYQLEEDERRRKAEYAMQMADHLSPMKSSSLAASRWRNELAAKRGITEHVGIL